MANLLFSCLTFSCPLDWTAETTVKAKHGTHGDERNTRDSLHSCSDSFSERSVKQGETSMNIDHNSSSLGMTRRQFAQALGMAGALGVVEAQTLVRALAESKRNLAYLANRTAGAEGAWELKKIESKVPKTLNGLSIRVAPGQKETFGVKLRHLFDGDAFISRYTFREGRVSLTARFLDTPQRLEELSVKRMLYAEAGTIAPPPPDGYKPKYNGKNQPSVNIIRWDGRLLGLSEGGHPTAIDLKTLSFQSE